MFMQGPEELTQDHRDARFKVEHWVSNPTLAWVEDSTSHPFDFFDANDELDDFSIAKLARLTEGELVVLNQGSGLVRVTFLERGA